MLAGALALMYANLGVRGAKSEEFSGFVACDQIRSSENLQITGIYLHSSSPERLSSLYGMFFIFSHQQLSTLAAYRHCYSLTARLKRDGGGKVRVTITIFEL